MTFTMMMVMVTSIGWFQIRQRGIRRLRNLLFLQLVLFDTHCNVFNQFFEMINLLLSLFQIFQILHKNRWKWKEKKETFSPLFLFVESHFLSHIFPDLSIISYLSRPESINQRQTCKITSFAASLFLTLKTEVEWFEHFYPLLHINMY